MTPVAKSIPGTVVKTPGVPSPTWTELSERWNSDPPAATTQVGGPVSSWSSVPDTLPSEIQMHASLS